MTRPVNKEPHSPDPRNRAEICIVSRISDLTRIETPCARYLRRPSAASLGGNSANYPVSERAVFSFFNFLLSLHSKRTFVLSPPLPLRFLLFHFPFFSSLQTSRMARQTRSSLRGRECMLTRGYCFVLEYPRLTFTSTCSRNRFFHVYKTIIPT